MGSLSPGARIAVLNRIGKKNSAQAVQRQEDMKNYEPTGDITEDGKKIMRKKTSSPTLAQSVDRQVLSQSTGRSSTLLGG